MNFQSFGVILKILILSIIFVFSSNLSTHYLRVKIEFQFIIEMKSRSLTLKVTILIMVIESKYSTERIVLMNLGFSISVFQKKMIIFNKISCNNYLIKDIKMIQNETSYLIEKCVIKMNGDKELSSKKCLRRHSNH
jgi:hypothetical protein